jgi:Sulfotransferase family
LVDAVKTFRDPVGLARRMLTDDNPTARRALARAAAAPLLRPVDAMLGREERRRLASAAPSSSAPMMLVVGAPRSGTTLVAQTLVHQLRVSFPTNLGAWFPTSPISAQRRFGRPLRASRTDRRNYYGQTPGLHDHNDAFHLWNRWLGSDRYRAGPLSDAATTDLRRFFAAWHATFRDPFVNKNNRNTDALVELADALPRATLLVVERDHDAVARSLITARRLVHGDEQRAWGLLARDATSPTDVAHAVDDQLAAIERRIDDALGIIDTTRIMRVRFEEFCADPDRLVAAIAARLATERIQSSTPPILH